MRLKPGRQKRLPHAELQKWVVCALAAYGCVCSVARDYDRMIGQFEQFLVN